MSMNEVNFQVYLIRLIFDLLGGVACPITFWIRPFVWVLWCPLYPWIFLGFPERFLGIHRKLKFVSAWTLFFGERICHACFKFDLWIPFIEFITLLIFREILENPIFFLLKPRNFGLSQSSRMLYVLEICTL